MLRISDRVRLVLATVGGLGFVALVAAGASAACGAASDVSLPGGGEAIVTNDGTTLFVRIEAPEAFAESRVGVVSPKRVGVDAGGVFFSQVVVMPHEPAATSYVHALSLAELGLRAGSSVDIVIQTDTARAAGDEATLFGSGASTLHHSVASCLDVRTRTAGAVATDAAPVGLYRDSAFETSLLAEPLDAAGPGSSGSPSSGPGACPLGDVLGLFTTTLGSTTLSGSVGVYAGGPNTLIKADPLLATTTTIGPGALTDGLRSYAGATDRVGARFFYVSRGSATTVPAAELVTVDNLTGLPVSSVPPPANALIGLKYDTQTARLLALLKDPTGGLTLSGLGVFMTSTGPNSLVEVDPLTGLTTPISATLPPGTANFAVALDSATGLLAYRAPIAGAATTAAGKIVVVDTITGLVVADVALPATARILRLFYRDGVLYGLDHDGASTGLSLSGSGLLLGATGPANLVSIDTTTGLTTPVVAIASGLRNFVAAFDCTTDTFFYHANDADLHALNMTTLLETAAAPAVRIYGLD